jgi:hypothetical protein
MKKISFVLVAIFIIGCTNDEPNSENVINYMDISINEYNFNLNEGSQYNYTPNNIIFEKLNGNVVKRKGYPIVATSIPGSQNYFTYNIYDTIFKENNKITIFNKVIPFNGITSIAPNKKEFFLNNDGKIIYKINYNQEYNNSDNDTVFFDYLDTKIIKTYSKNYGTKTKESNFYYNTNQNLDSIVTNFYSYDYQLNQMIVVPTYEVETFEQYDNVSNPFSSLTIFDDMFKRSLSKNNYKLHKITQYYPFQVKYQKSLTLYYDSMGNLIYKN